MTAKPIIVIVLVCLIVIGVYAWIRAGKLSAENAVLQAQVAQQADLFHQSEQAAKLAQAAYDKEIASRDADISHWQGVAGEYLAGMATGNQELAKLKSQLAALDPSQKDAIIVNQAQQIKVLESNLSLAYKTIEAKDAEIADWRAKFNASVTLSQSYRDEADKAKSLIDTQAKLVSDLQKELRVAKFWGSTTKVTTVAVAVVAGYLLVRGGSK